MFRVVLYRVHETIADVFHCPFNFYAVWATSGQGALPRILKPREQ